MTRNTLYRIALPCALLCGCAAPTTPENEPLGEVASALVSARELAAVPSVAVKGYPFWFNDCGNEGARALGFTATTLGSEAHRGSRFISSIGLRCGTSSQVATGSSVPS